MRLINARTLKLEEFWDKDVNDYAIVSHRWEDGEVSFRDMQDLAVASKMKGFTKIQKSCERAIVDSFNYVWLDTCCINKESSAELTEAIDSMYRWYERSAVCYTFLSDVLTDPHDTDEVEQQNKSKMSYFFNKHWDMLGTKRTLIRLLSLRTGIDEDILNGAPLSSRSIAQRMSWASLRITTRSEDTAYCLLGIFDVNMPMLYGEGEKAFLRLQEEIIKHSDDHSIFAWPIHRDNQPGLLADSPSAFANCQNMGRMNVRAVSSPYSLTNRGLSIKLLATPFMRDTYLVQLDCTIPYDDHHARVLLRRMEGKDQYARAQHEGNTLIRFENEVYKEQTAVKQFLDAHTPFLSEPRPTKQILMNVPQRISKHHESAYRDRINGFRIATPALLKCSSSGRPLFSISAASWNLQERIMAMKPGGSSLQTCTLDISPQDGRIKVIKLCFDFEYNPVCLIATEGGLWDYELSKGIHKRNSFNTTIWTNETGWAHIHLSLEEHPGLWALKGNRRDGLEVVISDFHKIEKGIKRLAKVKIKWGEFQNKLVWDVYIEDWSANFDKVIEEVPAKCKIQ